LGTNPIKRNFLSLGLKDRIVKKMLSILPRFVVWVVD
jgi:hypothetical protein